MLGPSFALTSILRRSTSQVRKRYTEVKPLGQVLDARIGTPASQIPKSRVETLLIWLPDFTGVREMKGESRREEKRSRKLLCDE